MEKKPFHEVVLDKIEKRIPLILSSVRAEQDIHEFGDILKDSFLTEEVATETVARLNDLTEKLSGKGDRRRAFVYLENLIKELSE